LDCGALAIHDIRSVVVSAAKYGAWALQAGTPVKLVRACGLFLRSVAI